MFADELVGISAAGERKHAHVELLLEKKIERALGGGLAGEVGVVVDDDATGEAAEEFDLRLGEAGAAGGHDIADAGAGHADDVHVAFHKHGKIAFADFILRFIEMIEHAAFGIDR